MRPASTPSRRSGLSLLALALPLLLSSCDDTVFGEGDEVMADPDAPSCDSDLHKAVFVIDIMAFAEMNDDGEVWGFDLDGDVTDLGDSKGCGKRDFTDPEGTEGIDNAFAQLLPALENTEAVAIKGLLQDAIASGELLLMLEVTGLDDLENDDCVTVTFGQALGDPLIGTDTQMLDGQSFGRDPDRPPVVMEGATLVDGTVMAEGLAFELNLQILDAPLAIKVTDGAVRMDLSPDGSEATGYFGGGFSIDYVMEVVDDNAIDDTLTELLRVALPAAADLDGPEGECKYMSVAFEYDAIPAFYYGE